jgi:hypothetical protein
MALTKSEVFYVVASILENLGKAYEDGKVTKSELLDVLQKAAIKAFAEYQD